MTLSCPHCGKRYPVGPEQRRKLVGRQVRCDGCGQPFDVPPVAATSSRRQRWVIGVVAVVVVALVAGEGILYRPAPPVPRRPAVPALPLNLDPVRSLERGSPTTAQPVRQPDGLALTATAGGPVVLLPPFVVPTTGRVAVTVELTCPQPEEVRVFWLVRGADDYGEDRKLTRPVQAGRQSFDFDLSADGLTGQIRLDLGDDPGGCVIHAIHVRAVPPATASG